MKLRPLLFIALAIPSFAWAAESAGLVATDLANAGPDFAIQGEYVSDKGAAQVIALGEGKFHIVGFAGGLPGAAADAEKKAEADAARKGDTVSYEKDGWTGTITGEELTAKDPEGNSMRLTKTTRKSPTSGAQPPAGAIVLFDGKTADAWEGGKMDAEGNLQGGVKSKQPFGDCTLHVEFRTPFMPAARGQGRGNSGVYLQDRFEVQVLDSFGLNGENNECGGIYTIAKPKVNMCFPPLSWQTYDIDFQAARYGGDGKKTANANFTVKHNGVLIHDHVDAPHTTTSAGRAEGPEPGPIQLQNHGTPVVFRNIWIVPRG